MSDSLRLGDRLRAHWRMKLWLGALLGTFFCAGYFTLQRVTIRPPRTFELTAIDRWAGFSPAWVWVYQSWYLLLPLAWFAETREQLQRYTLGFVITSVIAFAFFLFWPVAGPRPTDVRPDGMYGLLVSYDTPLNTFPSLHVALSTYSVFFFAAVTGRAAPPWVILLAAWVVLVCYSTLATKQHYFVDVPAGIALGWFGHAVAGRLQTWTRSPRAVAAERGAA